jgi:hypothetical protein
MMHNNPKYRYQWYQRIYECLPQIRADAKQAAHKLGIDKVPGTFGLYAGSSSCPGRLPNYILDAIIAANRISILPMRSVEDDVRELVKDVYGESFDCAVANTCESALRVLFETLFAPPTMRKGDAYRARMITLYNEDFEYLTSYGRPFPPKYKNLASDRSVAAGELSVEGKSLFNLDAVVVPYADAIYAVHGIKQNVVSFLTNASAERTLECVRTVAERHASALSGFTSIGYDTPGYGHSAKDGDGVPRLIKGIGELARQYDVPYLVDNAGGLPIVGLGPAELGAELMVWSMDKSGRAPISGLIIGKEDLMVTVRKALGLGGQRYGEVSSHGKALFSLADPGRDAIVGLYAYLRVLRDAPARVLEPIDEFHQAIVDALDDFAFPALRKNILVTKSYTMGGTELNYERTWEAGNYGIPVFTMEDLFANTCPLTIAMSEMGVYPATVYGANMFLGPGQGTLDEDGALIKDKARLAARALVKSLEIVCNHAGLDA